MNAVERASILKESARWLAAYNPKQAQALLDEITDAHDRGQMTNAMIQTLSHESPARAAEWVSGSKGNNLAEQAHETMARE